MNKYFLLNLLLVFIVPAVKAQNTAITVGGDIDKFYPVVFKDNNWYENKASILEIGRSSVHQDETWKGALIAKFVFHVTKWGNGAEFIEADIKHSRQPFIAGWLDATHPNGNIDLIIWLKGGGTTYFLNGNTSLDYTIYDGLQAPLPFQQENGYAYGYKEAVDDYVNGSGKTLSHSVFLNSEGINFINGSLGIGTKGISSGEKLSVNGKIRAKEIKVETANWPDYVFEGNYQLPDLKETEDFIKTNKHLPGIPSAKEVEEHGVSLGEMNAKLLKKVEELTLYIINQESRLNNQEKLIGDLLKKQNK